MNLCDTCQHCRVIRNDRRSIFLLCERALTDPSFPKYPPLPVLNCRGYDPLSPYSTDSPKDL
jgi:hypothetical protein